MNSYFRHAPGVASRLVAGEAVLVRLPAGEMTILNETASALWALADGTRTADGLADALRARYALDETPALTAFLDELVSNELLARAERSEEPEETIPLPEATAYEPPARKANEPIETLAGMCDSGFGGIYSNCQSFGSCLDPWT